MSLLPEHKQWLVLSIDLVRNAYPVLEGAALIRDTDGRGYHEETSQIAFFYTFIIILCRFPDVRLFRGITC
jgi:hypothetical protein